jgi:uncharacterized protein
MNEAMVVRTLAFMIVQQLLGLVGLGPSPDAKDPNSRRSAYRSAHHPSAGRYQPYPARTRAASSRSGSRRTRWCRSWRSTAANSIGARVSTRPVLSRIRGRTSPWVTANASRAATTCTRSAMASSAASASAGAGTGRRAERNGRPRARPSRAVDHTTRAAPTKASTPLHVATDWPGYYTNGPAIVAVLIAAGADPNARTEGGPAPETPLHWVASSDDVDVADALIDAGADLEAAGGSIGTPLDNAIGYGCWHVARRLVQRGARVDKLWHAAALGLLPRVEELLSASPPPTAADINEAFWQACHGGQRRTAELLVRRGADATAVPGYAQQTALEIAGTLDTRREILTTWLREQAAGPNHRPR